MADRQGGGDTAVFVHDEGVRHARGGTGAPEFGEDELAAVDARGGREEEAEFLGEGQESGGWGAGGGQQGAWVREDGDWVGVFVVDVVDVVVVVVVMSVGFVIGIGLGQEGLSVEGSSGGGFGGAEELGSSV